MSPNYRLKNSAVEALCEDVYFNSYTPKNGDVCVDIGAGIGTETRVMSGLVGQGGRIFSIEASPKTCKALELCIKYNNLRNVTAHNCAISNENGMVGISDKIGNHIENVIMKNGGQEGGCMVKSLSLDDYISDNKIESIDYMKINIEGAETLMIQAFKAIKKVKHIAISSHDFLGKRTGNEALFTSRALMEFLRANNFEIYTRSTGIDYKDGWIYGKNKAFQD